MLRQVFLLLGLLTLTEASYCGQSAIPFSIEVRFICGQVSIAISDSPQRTAGFRLRKTNMVRLLQLGNEYFCAFSFGWNAEGKRAADPAMFYKIGQRMDGFLRSTDKAGLAVKNASIFQPQFSVISNLTFQTFKVVFRFAIATTSVTAV